MEKQQLASKKDIAGSPQSLDIKQSVLKLAGNQIKACVAAPKFPSSLLPHRQQGVTSTPVKNEQETGSLASLQSIEDEGTVVSAEIILKREA